MSDSIYTEHESQLLEKTRKVRENIIDEMIKDGVPYKSGDIRVLNEVLSGLSKDIQDSAIIRNKHQDSANQEAIIATVAETLKAVSRKQSSYVRTEADITPNDDVINTDVIEGELIIEPDKLEIEDFVNEDNS